MGNKRARLFDARDDRVVATIGIADAPSPRMVGLLRHRRLDDGDGLALMPCSMIHTCFMRFAIDVAFIDRDGTIVRTAERVRPFRFVWGGWRARTTIELAPGALGRHRLAAGDRVRIERL